jgi:hypothetical protein
MLFFHSVSAGNSQIGAALVYQQAMALSNEGCTSAEPVSRLFRNFDAASLKTGSITDDQTRGGDNNLPPGIRKLFCLTWIFYETASKVTKIDLARPFS